ncbi:MAG: tetratricopeptide repeat protein [Clostridia bacterium]|nr:tetratricopeptide repeat protein [Clostridia bacterium]
MPYSKERAERLTELFELIEKNGDYDAYELTYRAVPYLAETNEIVEAQLATEEPYDKVTLLDSAAIMRYLAEAYDRLGRFAVSVSYYKRAIELAAKLYATYGEEIKDSSGMIYNALKARNYYVDDDCEDIRKQALVFLSEDIVDDVFDTVMKRRRNLKHDPVEMTKEYLAVIDEVDEKIEKNREYRGFGSCHHVWSLKTDYLAEKGITWNSPVVLNPKVRFD